MELVFLILKTAGIVLLVILGLVLLLAALLLFVPVRYQAEGELPETAGPAARVRFSWLFSLLTVRIEYADGLKVSVRAAGIRIRPERWIRRAAGPSGPEPVEKEPEPMEKESEPVEKEPEPMEREREPAGKTGSSGMESPPPCEAASESTETGRRESFSDIPRRLLQRMKQLAGKTERICNMAEWIRDKAEWFYEEAAYYRALFAEEESRRAAILIRTHLGKLLSHAKPRQLSVNLTVGAEDPAVTGRVLAVNGMLYPWIREAVRVTPDFERECLYGDFYAKGRIRAGVALYHILRVVLDKRTWTLIRRLKRRS